MSVADLHPQWTPNPEMVATILTGGLTNPESGAALWADVEAAQQILQVSALIAQLKATAARELVRLLEEAETSFTLAELYNSEASAEDRRTLERLFWIQQLPQPVGE